MAHHDPSDADLRRGIEYALQERLAPYYERHLVGDCHYRTHHVVAEAVSKFAPRAPAPAPRFLDLGAGTGLVGKALDARASHEPDVALELIAFDISEAMLEQIDSPRYVERRVGDCLEPLPFADATLAGAIAAGLFEHVREPATVLHNVARVLAPGAAFCFTFPTRRPDAAAPFDESEGLAAHPVAAIHAALASARMTVDSELEYPAYLNGTKGWVQHHLVVCRTAPSTTAAAFSLPDRSSKPPYPHST